MSNLVYDQVLEEIENRDNYKGKICFLKGMECDVRYPNLKELNFLPMLAIQ